VIDLESELRGGLTDAANLVTTSPDPWGDYQRRTTKQNPRRRRLSVGFSVAAIAAATAGIVIAAVVLASGGATHHPTRLAGGQTVTLTPRTPIGAAELARSATIIEHRLTALGVKGTRVQAFGGSLQAQVPASAVATLTTAAHTRGVLRIRQALALAPPGATQPQSDNQVVAVRGPAESPTLTKAFLALFAEWDCARYPNPTHGNDRASDYIIGCSTDGSAKYLLAPATVEGTQITSASATLDSQTGTHWVVDLTFNRSGAGAWLQLTAKAYNVNQGRPQTTSCKPPVGCDAVAVVLDGVVVSAPYISQSGGIPGGVAQISGSFTQSSASQLAAVLKQGPLPTTFTVGGR
jgi:preprotein translocase subunit SecD